MKPEIKKSADYEIVLVASTFFLILYFIMKQPYLLYIGAGIAVLSLLSKTLAGYICWIWNKIFKAFGYVNSRVILSIIFFLVLLPVSLIARLFRKDELQLKRQDHSYYKERNQLITAKDIENPW